MEKELKYTRQQLLDLFTKVEKAKVMPLIDGEAIDNFNEFLVSAEVQQPYTDDEVKIQMWDQLKKFSNYQHVRFYLIGVHLFL